MLEIRHLFFLPQLNLPIGLFGDKEYQARGQTFSGIVKGLLSSIFLEKSLNPVPHMLEVSKICCMQHMWLVQIRRQNSNQFLKGLLRTLNTMSFIRVGSMSSVVCL